MGVILKRRVAKERSNRRGRNDRRTRGELDDLIEYGKRALTAPGSAPLAMQLDTALRLAGLHLRRAQRGGESAADDVRWAAMLASFVADRSADTSPAAVVDLGSRAAAVLDLCVADLNEVEASAARSLACTTRERVARAEHICALSLDDAVASLTIAQALIEHAPDGDDREVVIGRARSLLATSAITSRRAGYAPLADTAIALLEQVSDKPAPPTARGRRGLRRSRG